MDFHHLDIYHAWHTKLCLSKHNFVYVKLEQYNITGSIKDRIAYYMIKKAKKEGLLPEGKTIVEATSGNTAVSYTHLRAHET